MLSHSEAQELHELLGAQIEAWNAATPGMDVLDVTALRRARQLAAVLVSDTMPPDPTEVPPRLAVSDRDPAAVQVVVPAEAWRPCADVDAEDYVLGVLDEWTYLLATLVVNGVSLHLEAFEVWPSNGRQVAKLHDDQVTAYAHAAGSGEPFQTMTIGGRQYVVVATPYEE